MPRDLMIWKEKEGTGKLGREVDLGETKGGNEYGQNTVYKIIKELVKYKRKHLDPGFVTGKTFY